MVSLKTRGLELKENPWKMASGGKNSSKCTWKISLIVGVGRIRSLSISCLKKHDVIPRSQDALHLLRSMTTLSIESAGT